MSEIADFNGNQVKITVEDYGSSDIGLDICLKYRTIASKLFLASHQLEDFFEQVLKAYYFLQTKYEKQADGNWKPKDVHKKSL